VAQRSNDWHITGPMAILLLPIAIPVALFFAISGIGRYKDRSAQDVAGFIQDFIEGTGGDWDWDDFISVSIKDPKLESIRKQASMIDLPTTAADIEILKELLAKTEQLASGIHP
jgi:hypothetical protein